MQDFCPRINMLKGNFFKQSCKELWFVKNCRNCTFNVNFLCQKLPLFILFRQVIVGEHTLAEDPDCVNGGNFCLPNPQKFGIDKVTQHQNWVFKLFQEGYDIALVRIRGEIKLFVSIIQCQPPPPTPRSMPDAKKRRSR